MVKRFEIAKWVDGEQHPVILKSFFADRSEAGEIYLSRLKDYFIKGYICDWVTHQWNHHMVDKVEKFAFYIYEK